MTGPSLEIKPIPHELKATVRVPGSKSLTNRALLIASLADGRTRLTNALFSDDTRLFAGALQALGFEIDLDESNSEIVVTGLGGRIPAQKAELFVGNAGTAARFLSAFLTLGNGEFIVDGDARMRQRPMGDLVSALSQLGATIKHDRQLPARHDQGVRFAGRPHENRRRHFKPVPFRIVDGCAIRTLPSRNRSRHGPQLTALRGDDPRHHARLWR